MIRRFGHKMQAGAEKNEPHELASRPEALLRLNPVSDLRDTLPLPFPRQAKPDENLIEIKCQRQRLFMKENFFQHGAVQVFLVFNRSGLRCFKA